MEEDHGYASALLEEERAKMGAEEEAKEVFVKLMLA